MANSTKKLRKELEKFLAKKGGVFQPAPGRDVIGDAWRASSVNGTPRRQFQQAVEAAVASGGVREIRDDDGRMIGLKLVA